MLSFYISLWLFWLVRMLILTPLIGVVLSACVTFVVYAKEGFAPLSADVFGALFDIFSFWFILLVNLALLIALFVNTKYFFNRCYNGFSLKLLSCSKNEDPVVLEEFGYGDLVKVWRKWLLLIVYHSGAFVLLTTLFYYFFYPSNSLLDWFSISILYIFIHLAGFFSLFILANYSKNVRIEKC